MVYTVKSLTEIYKINEKFSLKYFCLFDKSIEDENRIVIQVRFLFFPPIL